MSPSSSKFAAKRNLKSTALLAALLLLQLGTGWASWAVEKKFVFCTSNNSTFSKYLGVISMPAYVIIDGARHPGIYITSKPSLELGKNMGLHSGLVLLTIDGYSMTSSQVADNWLSNRTHNKQISFTVVKMSGDKPKIYSSQVAMAVPVASSSKPSSGSSPKAGFDLSTSSAQESTDELERFDLGLINDSRKSAGLNTVTRDGQLSRLAQEYADYMADHAPDYELSNSRSPHIDLQGRNPQERAREAGVSMKVLENIGRGSRGPFGSDKAMLSRLHGQMMSEPPGTGHRGTIENPSNTCVGIGIARSPNRIYLTQEFGY